MSIYCGPLWLPLLRPVHKVRVSVRNGARVRIRVRVRVRVKGKVRVTRLRVASAVTVEVSLSPIIHSV